MTSEAPRRRPAAIDTPAGRFEFAPHNCFACGTLNAGGLGLDAPRRARAGRGPSSTLDRRFEGWEAIAHGGILCTILDEVMAWALVGEDNWGVTARMAVDFRRPVPVGMPIRAEGWITRSRRRDRRHRRPHRRRRRPARARDRDRRLRRRRRATASATLRERYALPPGRAARRPRGQLTPTAPDRRGDADRDRRRPTRARSPPAPSRSSPRTATAAEALGAALAELTNDPDALRRRR